LRDGVTMFDKKTLKKSSDVFNSMFSSDFRENTFNEVKFSEYTTRNSPAWLI
jgi:hypothetical protein